VTERGSSKKREPIKDCEEKNCMRGPPREGSGERGRNVLIDGWGGNGKDCKKKGSLDRDEEGWREQSLFEKRVPY